MSGKDGRTPGASERTPRLQPRWFIVLFWKVHRALVRVTGGRLGLWRARAQRWGAMRMTTIGRRSGQERAVILGYIEDGPNLVTLAMNGWAEAERLAPSAPLRSGQRLEAQPTQAIFIPRGGCGLGRRNSGYGVTGNPLRPQWRGQHRIPGRR